MTEDIHIQTRRELGRILRFGRELRQRYSEAKTPDQIMSLRNDYEVLLQDIENGLAQIWDVP